MPLGSKSDLRILIAMDNGQAAEGAKAVFKEQRVATSQIAEGKRDALRRMNETAFNLILVEDTFSDLGGIDFVRYIRMTNSPMSVAPIIYAMKEPSRESVIEARDVGVNKMIVMPFTTASLLKNLADIMLNPRPFVTVTGYSGPCRRLNQNPYTNTERRLKDEGLLSIEKQQKIFKGS